MKHLPKVRIDLNSNFKEDQIAREKLYYLHGGDGGTGGGGNDGGGDPSNPPMFP